VQAARNLLALHNLQDLETRYPAQLSAGERQFSSLLAAIATNPKVLVADEPSRELDNESAEIMYKMLNSLANQTSVILVTHDARAEKYADRVVQIREGRISEQWLPGQEQKSVVDPFGWMRVRENHVVAPKRDSKKRVPSSDALIRGEGLSLSYESREIFSQINIEGFCGQLIALTSASGSGKSSLLRILCGIQNPTDGQVYFKGVPLRDLSRQARAEMRKESVGFLGQGGSALGNISLRDHFMNLPMNLDTSLRTRLLRPLSSFSGGERARIELLKILAESKPILLLDEPTSQMDENRSLETAELLLNFVDQGGLIITSTRDSVLLENADLLVGAQ
jgi:ABC-type lipoprotein export system ATPase subunit